MTHNLGGKKGNEEVRVCLLPSNIGNFGYEKFQLTGL